jgi:DMSO/TMAO reductase YedYZ molybdopterin-dependent catalytic subunit
MWAVTVLILAPVRALARPWLKSPQDENLTADWQPVADMTPDVTRPHGAISPITPVSNFYVEDIAGPPESLQPDATGWSLSVTGQIERPLTLNYQDLLQRPAVTRIITLSCIGNPIGGYAIGNAEWTGLPLKALIDEADPDFFANRVVLKGADGYHDSLPLSATRDAAALLVHTMNGKPLTRDHGFPVRVLVPGYYGIKQVKWLTGIEITRGPYKGYWQKRNWTGDGRVKIISRIDHPRHDEWLETRRTTLRGIAFAGDRGIQYVQVSLDGEKSWSLAQLEKPLSPYAWVFWSFPVTFPGSGRYRIAVRAADQYSGVQRDDGRDPFPSGTSGIHRIEVKVL